MALSIPGGFLESTREIRVRKVILDDSTVELFYELKHEDGSVDTCWGINMVTPSTKQQYAELKLATWMGLPVHIGAIAAPFSGMSIGVIQVQVIPGQWIKPQKDASGLWHA